MGLNARKPVLGGLAKKNKGADLSAYERSLISTFVIGGLESIISTLATGEISIFAAAKETGSSIVLSETQQTGFLALRPT